MKHYLAVFTGPPSGMDQWNAMDPTERTAKEKAGKDAWQAWATRYQPAIVNLGGPLGKTKRVRRDGITDVRNDMGAWLVVQADSQDEAARMFEGHPHFTIFPGEAVDVMEVLPIPGM